MKPLLGFVFGLICIHGFAAQVEAVINIKVATIDNGVVHVEGDQAPKSTAVVWQGVALANVQTTNGGAFKFDTTVRPASCVGNLNIGLEERDVVIANCTPSLDPTLALVPQTGQTSSFAFGDDGYYQAGVRLPSPRFTENGDGTITDKLTGLIWLKDANCFGQLSWLAALKQITSLQSGQCGLTDGSVIGTWRLPNIRELHSLIDFNFFNPAIAHGPSLGGCGPECPFSNLPAGGFGWMYWSSSANNFHFGMSLGIWVVDLFSGEVRNIDADVNSLFVLAVRGGL
jgi:hypothetical protein